jgi:ADP-ribose pyrophosphatase
MFIPIKTLTSTLKYQNPWMKVYEDEIEFADGSPGIYGVIDRQHGVGALVITEKNEILLANQFRYPIQDYSWEIPGGGRDENETGNEAIARELREETGLDLPAEQFVSHGSFYSLNSCSREQAELFSIRVPSIDLATIGTTDTQEGILEYALVSFDDIPRWILEGKITDSCTAMAMLLAPNLKQ